MRLQLGGSHVNTVNTGFNPFKYSAHSQENEIKNIIAQTSDEKLKMFQAQDPNADPHLLDTLANDDKWYIRMAVAQNRRTLLTTLDRLSLDNDFRVQCGVAVNPNICASKEILDRLSNNYETNVLKSLTGNPALPALYLEKLHANNNWEVRWGVARHPNTDTNILEKLSKDPEPLVRWGVSENPACPPEILRNLSIEEYLFTRWAVASHQNTPVNVLQTLVNDKIPDVRKAAIENLKLRGIKAQTFNPSAVAASMGILLAPLYNLFRKKNQEKTRVLPNAKGITVTQGYYKGAKFNLVSVDPKLNETLVYLAPQKKDGSFETRSLDFAASKYPGTHAVLNGSFFNNYTGGDNQPLGPVIYRDGKYFWTPTTKNYEGLPVYSFNRPFFAIDKNGVPMIRQSEGKRAEELLRDGYKALLGGGGPLIQDGKIIVSEKTLNDAKISPQTHQINKRRQRTCVGIKEDGTILLCTFGYQKGNNPSYSGITLPDLAEFMLSKGAKEALFFDGGGSTGLYLSDEGCAITDIPRKQPTYLIFTDKASAKFINTREEENEKIFRGKK